MNHQQPTVRSSPVPVAPTPPQRIPNPAPQQQRKPPPPAKKQAKKKKSFWRGWLLIAGIGVFSVGAFLCAALTIGGMMIYGNGILPGVQVAGLGLGGLSPEEAEAALLDDWRTVTLRDDDRIWKVERETLGITLDAGATAQLAYDTGRADPLNAVFGQVEVAPVMDVDSAVFTATLQSLSEQINIPPTDAGIAYADGQVRATPPEMGRMVNIPATLDRLDDLADGTLDLVMLSVQPSITDATPILEAASRLLANPLLLRVYDPVTGDSVFWSQPPSAWAAWITSADSTTENVQLALNEQALRQFLIEQSDIFDETRYLNLDEAIATIQDAIRREITTATLRVYHHDRQHIVQSGETIVSIAWDYGVPYPWVQQANPGVESLSVGQAITIPSPDNFLPFEVVPDKRIVVSISEQRTRVYEQGELIWDWASSTGISSSPTWPGVYQIISQEPNAYAGNWDLWMPNFMGVYQPVPGADFTNGFHGFPTRGGGQLLWENSLGSRVTYGCILLSDENIALLWDWAATGVVVEIRA